MYARTTPELMELVLRCKETIRQILTTNEPNSATNEVPADADRLKSSFAYARTTPKSIFADFETNFDHSCDKRVKQDYLVFTLPSL